MNYRAKKTLLVTTLVAALVAGTLFYDTRPSQSPAALGVARQAQTLQRTATPAAGAAPPKSSSHGYALKASANAQASGNSGAVNETQVSYSLSDGNFTGQRVYAYYGYVQVQAVVQNGKILQVNVLEHPNDNGTSRYINSVAMPYLVQEAVQVQSANVNLISGATLSSEAFVKSLSSALTQAGA